MMSELTNKKNILITGGTGFVGSHLCEALKKQGHEIYVLVRTPEKLKMIDCEVYPIKGHLSSQEPNPWIQDLPNKIHVVYHLAGIVHSFDDDEFEMVNFNATERLLLDLKEKFNQIDFIFLSSLAAAGPSTESGKPINESTPESPVSNYGKSKLKAERYLHNNLPEGWRFIIFRPPMIIGPRDPAVLDVFKMVDAGFVPIVGHDGHKNRYSFICVFDLIDILVAAHYQLDEFNKRTYFTSNPKSECFEDIVNAIQATQEKRRVRFIHFPFLFLKFLSLVAFFLNRYASKVFKLDIRVTPDKLNELKQSSWECDGTKVSNDFNLEYKWDLKSTVQITNKDYLDRGWIK